MEKLLDSISSPKQLKKLTIEQLEELAGEIREKIIKTTSTKGGHLSASLGAVELTIAVHYCLSSGYCWPAKHWSGVITSLVPVSNCWWSWCCC